MTMSIGVKTVGCFGTSLGSSQLCLAEENKSGRSHVAETETLNTVDAKGQQCESIAESLAVLQLASN